MPNLLGSAPNQCPTNGDLGKLAFMDVVDTVTNNPYLDTAISDTKPSLLLDFANSKTLDPRITYTRASTATYYDGKTTAVAEQNLLYPSQQLSTFTQEALTATANAAVAPDGTTTADSVIPSTGNVVHRIYKSTIYYTGPVTHSVFVKANGYTKVALRENTSTGDYATYDLSAVSVMTTGGTVSNTAITSVGNGWYRISVTFGTTATQSFGLYILSNSYTTGNPASTTFAGDGTSGIYIWGAQLEQRSSVTSYTPTTSSPITNYIPALQTAAAGVPRFDHDPVTGESKGLLIEEQRTNLLTYSSAFDNAAWTKSNATITADTIVAPDGTLTGDKVVTDTVLTAHGIIRYVSGLSDSTQYTWSFYAKPAEYNWVCVFTTDKTGATYASYVNLATGAVGTVAGGHTITVTSKGNGWYLVSCTSSTGTGATTPNYRVELSTGNGVRSFLGDGYSGIYIWGAQLEAGSFATSYIPTTSAQVTRSADAASITGANFSSWYNQAEGTLYADVAPTSSLGNRVSLDFNAGGASSSYITLFAQRSTSLGVLAYVNANGIAQVDASSQTNADGKTVFAYRTNDFAMTRNGSVAFDDTNGSVPQGIDRVFIGDDYNAGNAINGTIKRIAYYPKRLSDAELQEMTQ